MAEHVQRYRQYEYRANSNLVLTADTHRPRTDEPSGEPESLKEHLDGTKFGDRVHFSKPDLVDGGKKRRPAAAQEGSKRSKKDSETVLGLSEDIDSYRPRSKETRSAYEDLLSLISRQLGDQPHDILRGAADEVLACLKNDGMPDPERKREVEKLVNTLSSEVFAQLVQYGKRITDYAIAEGAGNDKLDDELGVAVVFDEDDDDEADGRDARNDDDAMVAEDISDDEDGAKRATPKPAHGRRALRAASGLIFSRPPVPPVN
jgi:pre-mRNA-splicing helicase BRR2